ncbi:unnamed protein product [Rotaria sp. Silwood1]|nr:unnamed protein product [Rotaria sp. Silwood1]CAF1630192.1 unnamed protein product [Rotaria sp. Silwood1]CAF3828562.1 unnamed protein product [Rotaria sp. Silwood1]CAF3855194.1 unnamed protein product [Rotaria sp. Silwood1]CAF3962376.1 unnamed protein product [Rotaria sp. Silwood1]
MHICPHIQENNLNSVKNVYIRNPKMTDNCVNYFSNATELTIQYRPQICDDALVTNVDRIIPLEQLTKLVLHVRNFSFDEFIKLLCLTPNLHTLKFFVLSLDKTSSKLIQKSRTFQYVSKANKITNLELLNWCTTLEEIKLIFKLFLQIEYLKISIDKKEIEQIIRFLFSKPNNKIYHLFSICISRLPKRCLKELKTLIESENLLDDYFIKFAHHDLYLWW